VPGHGVAPTALSSGGKPPTTARLALVAAPVVEEIRPHLGVRCPSCETTVMPLTGWCPYCMEPLPVDSATSSASPVSDSAAGEPVPTALGAQLPVGLGLGPVRTGRGRTRRVAATLVDAGAFIPALVALAFSLPIALVLLTMAALFTVLQLHVLQPRTGQTIGTRLTATSRVARRNARAFPR
jgi:hypothetical protein